MIKIGIIGFGYWGPNLARNFSLTQDCQIKYIIDLGKERLSLAQKMYPNVIVTQDIDIALNDNDLDAVIICSPVNTHFEFAKKALLNGKHVLIEKPMTRSTAEAEELIELASKKNKILMVDHTFLYTGAIKKIKETIDKGLIGDIQYFDSTRINLGLFQHDVNVVWDLAPHDISILLHLVKEPPYSVIATGTSHTSNKIENIAYITLNYQTNMIAHFNVSWTSPVKVRKTLIGGTKKMVVYDDLEPTEKVRIYDTGFKNNDSQQLLIDYRVGDIYIPKVEQTEALRGLANDFIQAITKNKKPLSDAKSGMDVVRILEAAQQSISNQGKEIKL